MLVTSIGLRRAGVLRPADPSSAAARPAGLGKPAAKVWRGPVSVLLASLVVLGLLIAVTTAILVVQSRQQALQEGEHELRSLALTLADQAERAFEAVDLVQTTFMEMVRADGAQTPQDFRKRMSSREVNDELLAHGSALAQLDVIALVDADGKFINISHTWPVPDVGIADRPYFKALKENAGQTTVISDPIVNRMTHTLAVVVAHRVTNPDGRFLGISFAGVLMSYFENFTRPSSMTKPRRYRCFETTECCWPATRTMPTPSAKSLARVGRRGV